MEESVMRGGGGARVHNMLPAVKELITLNILHTVVNSPKNTEHSFSHNLCVAIGN